VIKEKTGENKKGGKNTKGETNEVNKEKRTAGGEKATVRRQLAASQRGEGLEKYWDSIKDGIMHKNRFDTERSIIHKEGNAGTRGKKGPRGRQERVEKGYGNRTLVKEHRLLGKKLDYRGGEGGAGAG